MTPNLIHRSRALLLIVVVGGLLAGCNSTPRRDPEFAAAYPVADVPPQARQAASGAIYQAGYDLAFFEDLKARRVGDILTIRLAEANNAQKSADSTIDRQSGTTIENPTILGSAPQFNLPKLLPLASTRDNTLETNLSAQHGFEGAADAQLSNRLTGDITVTVADVLPNGNLYVRGEKRMNINDGNEYIKIAGIVRPVDIATDNSVPSTKVADATIVYNGDGAGADVNRPGWLTRFFVSIASPF
ncbi:MAG: flagellar basal body L-ring protein FlgH [Gammaproteobacteria bacterium]